MNYYMHFIHWCIEQRHWFIQYIHWHTRRNEQTLPKCEGAMRCGAAAREGAFEPEGDEQAHERVGREGARRARAPLFYGSGVRVQGAGCRVQGSGFRVQGSGLRVHGSGFRVQDVTHSHDNLKKTRGLPAERDRHLIQRA